MAQSAVRPALGLDSISASGSASADPISAFPLQPRLCVVQLPGPTRASWIETLNRRGALVLQYLPPHSYFVHASLQALETLPGELSIVWLGPFLSEWKLDPRLARVLSAKRPTDILDVIIQEFEVAGTADLADALARAGHAPAAISRFANRRHLRAGVPARLIAPLLAWDTVYRIEPEPERELFGERSSVISTGIAGKAAACVAPGYRDWLELKGVTGLGTIVQVADDGIEQGDPSGAPGTAHSDLLGRLAGFDNATSNPRADCTGGHGSINASIIAGNAAAGLRDADGFLLGLGIAPEASIFGTKIFDNFGRFDIGARTFSDLAQTAVEGGAAISSNSWGAIAFGEYFADSAEYDALSRDSHPSPGDQSVVYIFSAGNAAEFTADGLGSLGSPATAKNVISVGAAESCDGDGTDGCDVPPAGADSSRDIINFSSRGPCADGRSAPTLVATGTHVNGAASSASEFDGTSVCDKHWPEGQTLYARSSGTSHSAPQVAGAAALLFHRFQTRGGAPPSPALVKAALAASARDLAGGDNGLGGTLEPAPGWHQGWGNLQLDELIEDTLAGPAAHYADNPAVLKESGSEWETLLFPRDPTRPLRIALAWTDGAAVPGTSPTLVNDLDLEVEADGQLYLGNAFTGGRSSPGGEPDRLNNLECVFLDPPPRFVRARVRAHNIAGDGVPSLPGGLDQDFALAALNGSDQSSAGVVSWRARSLGCEAAASVTLSDRDLRGAGVAEVSITVPARGVQLELSLIEAPAGSGVFEGEQPLGPEANQLRVEHGDRLLVRYQDADDGTGRIAVSDAEASVDCMPPQAVSVLVDAIGENHADILVSLDEPARVTVQHGAACDTLRSTVASRLLTGAHRVRVQGLAAARKRFFALRLEDAAGNAVLADNAGKCFAFTTSRRVCAVDEDLEPRAGPGWTHGALSGSDPWHEGDVGDVAHSPSHAWEALLETPADAVLVTPGFDIAAGDILTFWHAYFFEGLSAGAVVEITLDDGQTWVDAGEAILRGGYTGDIEGGPLDGRPGWWSISGFGMTEVRLDVGRYSGPARRLRFRIAAGEDMLFAGWIIDDVRACRLLNRRAEISARTALARCDAAVGITLTDLDLENGGAAFATAEVKGRGAPMTLRLAEAETVKGIFSGELLLGSGDGRLAVEDGDRVVVRYADADDGINGAATAAVEIQVDCLPPVIAGVRILEVRDTTALVAWETDETTTGTAAAGDACGGTSASASTPLAGTAHRAWIPGLATDTPYLLHVVAADLAGNHAVEDAGGACRTFTPVKTCAARCETADDFTRWRVASDEGAGGWRFGAFREARSPPACWFAANPASRVDHSLVSPAFSVDSDTYLSFWHTFDLERSFDGGIIEASLDGGSTWMDLGRHIDPAAAYNGIISDTNPMGSRPAWTGGSIGAMRPVVVSLGDFAGASMRIRFRLGADASAAGVGWFIDDIEVCRAIRERGSISFDRVAYPCGATLGIELRDSGLIGRGAATVAVTSTTEPGGEIISLFEVPQRSGLFRGTLSLAAVDQPGALHAIAGDRLQARYIDADDGTGRAREVLIIADVDCEAPEIAGVTAVDASDEAVTIVWKTSGPTFGRVDIGTACGSLTRTLHSPELASEHRVRVGGLEPASLYFFRVVVEDQAGNAASADNAGACHSFRSGVFACQFEDTMEPAASDGWAVTGGLWRVAASPLAHSRSRAWSLNAAAGPHDAALMTPGLEAMPDSVLEFWHTFEIFSFDSGAFIEASTDGGETWEDLGARITEGSYTGEILESFDPFRSRLGWTGGQAGVMTRVRVALGELAGRRLHVRFRFFSLGEGFDEPKQWLIDDVRFCAPVGEVGVTYFSRPAYGCQDPVLVHVADANAVEPVTVELTSTSQARAEVLPLARVAPGLYRGNIALFNLQVPGLLFAVDGDSIRSTYRDADDGGGNAAVAEGLGRVDCTPATVADFRLEAQHGGTLILGWTASEPARCELEASAVCGASGTRVRSPFLGLTHEVAVALEPGAATAFRVHTRDAAGNLGTADNGGACFVVGVESTCSFQDSLEPAHDGWTHRADVGPDNWTLVTSAVARSRTHAWGGVAPDMEADASLYMPPLEIAAGGILSFWHTYEFEPGVDGGVLEISTDDGRTWIDLGPEVLIGQYSGAIFGLDGEERGAWTSGEIGAMQNVAVDLSRFAGAGRRIRFRILADFSIGAPGWLIDDVSLCTYSVAGRPARFARGNCSADEKLDLSDAIFLLNHLFRAGKAPACRRACDVNADDAISLADAVHLLAFLFQGGSPPPGPRACGIVVDTGPIECDQDACIGAP